MSVLPSFVIAGTVRSGTTSLHHYLGAHPEVYVAPSKEVHFFDRNYHRGRTWYEAHFDGHSTEKAIGEATPNYLFHGEAVPRLASMLPDAKIIVMLRNPADRAYSQYWMQRAYGNETLSFEEAISREDDRLSTGEEAARSTFGYSARSRYLTQLERLYEHYPSGQVMIGLYEKLRDEPWVLFREACRHLQINDSRQPENLGNIANAHRTFTSSRIRGLSRKLKDHGGLAGGVGALVGRLNSRATGYPDMAPETRRRLMREFGTDNEAIAALTGCDLTHWSS